MVPTAAPDTVPATPAALTLWQVALAQDAGIRHEGAVAPVRADSASRVPALIGAQRATLRVLQHQLDSLKAALPAEPAALALTDAVPPALVPDSATRPVLPPLHRWAVAALAEATTPWGVLPGPADAREMLGAAAAQSIQVEHRLANDRWLVRGGLGGVRLTSYFRAATEKTGQTLVSDTVTTVQTEVFTRTDTTLILHPYSQLFLNPRVNAGNQIIGYDSIWVPRVDTLYQVVVAHDTVRRSIQIVQTRLDTWREWREQQMRPSYRFWTIPVAVQYDVLRARRWRAGVSGGAQVLIFRGGEAPVRVGEGYELRRVGPREGPFRPVSVALTGGLDVRYRLSGRLSLLAGAGVRGWVQSPVRGEARPKVQPTGQVGLSWGLGGR